MSRSGGRARSSSRSGCALSQDVIADAAAALDAMTAQQRVALADDIFAEQPNLLASVLVHQRMGANLQQIEVLLNLLFVAHLAMKRSGRRWPLITEAIQDRCLQRLTDRLRLAQGLAPRRLRRAVQGAIDKHREPDLLAYAYGHLNEHGLLTIDTEAQKYLMLAALNLVESIAETTPPYAPATLHSAER
jgi:hypothetical protein